MGGRIMIMRASMGKKGWVMEKGLRELKEIQ
jgi:hypothetical protein